MVGKKAQLLDSNKYLPKRNLPLILSIAGYALFVAIVFFRGIISFDIFAILLLLSCSTSFIMYDILSKIFAVKKFQNIYLVLAGLCIIASLSSFIYFNGFWKYIFLYTNTPMAIFAIWWVLRMTEKLYIRKHNKKVGNK